MKAIHPMRFDAANALDAYSHKNHVLHHEDQHFLNIASRQRTSIMPWRGQFSPQLIEYLLRKHCKAGDRIVDPFCGSGTVLHEAAAQKMSAVGYDVNPAAVILAGFSKACLATMKQRVGLLDRIDLLFGVLLRVAGPDGEISVEGAPEAVDGIGGDREDSWLDKAFLLRAFGNSAKIHITNLKKARKCVRESLIGAPILEGELLVDARDARRMPTGDGSCSHAITSPPYINVLNYHQNYRPIIEAMGFQPLVAARSEIGANRKFRQNRFMTVTQYCMDIAETIVEMNRVLKDKGKATIVLGRTSSVRSVLFRNGELIAAISCDGIGSELVEWSERRFTNRFGETILEDVLTIIPGHLDRERAIAVGRDVGIQALKRALNACLPERREEIEKAIAASSTLRKSTYLDEASRDG